METPIITHTFALAQTGGQKELVPSRRLAG